MKLLILLNLILLNTSLMAYEKEPTEEESCNGVVILDCVLGSKRTEITRNLIMYN